MSTTVATDELGLGAGYQAGADRQYLTFFLGGETYGIEILRVQETIALPEITPMPRTPVHVRGVINLRGAIVPVLDLRAKFGGDPTELGAFTVVVVVNAGRRTAGILVDSIADVLSIGSEEIDDTFDECLEIDTDLLKGLARTTEELVLLLDIERLVATATPNADTAQPDALSATDEPEPVTPTEAES